MWRQRDLSSSQLIHEMQTNGLRNLEHVDFVAGQAKFQHFPAFRLCCWNTHVHAFEVPISAAPMPPHTNNHKLIVQILKNRQFFKNGGKIMAINEMHGSAHIKYNLDQINALAAAPRILFGKIKKRENLQNCILGRDLPVSDMIYANPTFTLEPSAERIQVLMLLYEAQKGDIPVALFAILYTVAPPPQPHEEEEAKVVEQKKEEVSVEEEKPFAVSMSQFENCLCRGEMFHTQIHGAVMCEGCSTYFHVSCVCKKKEDASELFTKQHYVCSSCVYSLSHFFRKNKWQKTTLSHLIKTTDNLNRKRIAITQEMDVRYHEFIDEVTLAFLSAPILIMFHSCLGMTWRCAHLMRWQRAWRRITASSEVPLTPPPPFFFCFKCSRCSYKSHCQRFGENKSCGCCFVPFGSNRHSLGDTVPFFFSLHVCVFADVFGEERIHVASHAW